MHCYKDHLVIAHRSEKFTFPHAGKVFLSLELRPFYMPESQKSLVSGVRPDFSGMGECKKVSLQEL
jgi:hypothetical protein